jgi:hypothetical protein
MKMKRVAKNRLSVISPSILLLAFLFCFPGFSVKMAAKSKPKNQPDFRDFYGICWNGKVHDNLAFAKQMGYDFVFYQRGMENDPLARDLKFYLESPQYAVYPVPRIVDVTKSLVYSSCLGTLVAGKSAPKTQSHEGFTKLKSTIILK